MRPNQLRALDSSARLQVRARSPILVIVLAVVIFLTLRGRAIAGTPRLVRVAHLAHWPPHYLVDPGTSEPGGFAVSVMNDLARRADLQLEYVVFPTWSELNAAYARGEVDVIPDMGITDARSERCLFTSPLLTFELRLYTRASSRDIEEIEDLRGRGVSVVRTNVGEEVVPMWPGVKSVPYDSLHEAVLALLAGRTDALVYPAPPLETLIVDAGLADRVKDLGVSLGEVKRGVAIRPGLADLHRSLSAHVEDLVKSPSYQDLLAEWYRVPPPYWTSGRVATAMGSLLLLLFVIMAIWRHLSLRSLNRRLARTLDETARAERRNGRLASLLQAVRTTKQAILRETDPRVLLNQTCEALVRARDYEAAWVLLTGPQGPMIAGRAGASAPPLGPTEKADSMASPEGRFALEFEGRRAGELALALAQGQAMGEDDRDLLEEVAADLAEKLQHLERSSQQTREVLSLQEQLQHSQKMEPVALLAGGVAHDFNNILSVMLGTCEMMRDDVAPSDPICEDLCILEDAAERARLLTAQLLTFSRRQIQEPKALCLGEIVGELEGMLQRLLGERYSLRIARPPASCTVLSDSVSITQVVMNLVVNARDAMPGGGAIDIEVREVLGGEVEGADPDSRWILLEVRDVGAGIAPEDLPRVFEPLFTTKESGVGTGLGLSTSRSIVEQSGGRITVESRLGEGTTFRVVLPRVGEEPEVRDEARSLGPVDLEGVTILLVEDDEAVRLLLSKLLDRHQATVLAAVNGEEALELFEAHRGSVDVLVTDAVLPGLSGPELALRLRAERPQLPVFLVTGYAPEAVADLLHELDDITVVCKPFRWGDLMQKLVDSLKRAP